MHRYYEEKGFGVIVTARLLNVLALAFTVVFSGFLLLSVKWRALHSDCVVAGTCDIAEVSDHSYYTTHKCGLFFAHNLHERLGM